MMGTGSPLVDLWFSVYPVENGRDPSPHDHAFGPFASKYASGHLRVYLDKTLRESGQHAAACGDCRNSINPPSSS